MKTLNTYISVCIFALFSLSGHSKSLLDESPIVLDTLYANESKNVVHWKRKVLMFETNVY